jgi:toxin FitB
VRWLLDTNVISESVRPNPKQKILDWIASHPLDDCAISIVTLAELNHGVVAVGDAARRDAFDEWMNERILPSFGSRTLQLTLDVLVQWLDLSRRLGAKGRPKSAADLMIAATARVHNLTVVTRNVRDFANSGVVVYDPWNGKTHQMDLP